MNDILLYTSLLFILVSYVGYFLIILFGKKRIISDSNAFDVTKELMSEYDSINIIESKSYFSVYNIKRRVIKLASSVYYGKDLSSVVISLIEAGIFIVYRNKNKYIDYVRIFFSNIKILYLFPLIVLLINNSSFNVNDAKIGIIIVSIFTFISYIIIDVKSQGIYWINQNLKKVKDINKNNRLYIVNFMNKVILFDKLIYFGELLIIVRFILMMLNII